ncbi:NAD-dependent epimerase/dehydratase family protein [Rhodococcus hoagii]|nr:NAD-dependent epimerase/dehydratase family protein [Prescottella equi]
MRIAITGATGNLGTALLQALREDGDHEIVGIARRRPPDEPPYAGVAWHTVDVAAPDAAEQLAPVHGCRRRRPPRVGFPAHPSTPLPAATGVDGTRAVLAAAATGGAGHVVHMSSSAVYAPGSYGRPVDESWPTTVCGPRSTAGTRWPPRTSSAAMSIPAPARP